MSRNIKVATYNIRKTIGLDRRRNPARTLDVLNEIDADIIALQEADRRVGARESSIPAAVIEAETPWRYVPFNSRNARAPVGMGMLFWSAKNVEITNAGPLKLPMLEPRGAVEAELVISGHPIRVIGAHLDLSGLWRRRQIRWLLAHLDSASRDLPTVMMGDFNQWSQRGALSEFAFHHHRIIKTPKSFHSARPVAQLDRIIVSHDIGVVDSGAHISRLSKRASDHLPIWAQLELPNI